MSGAAVQSTWGRPSRPARLCAGLLLAAVLALAAGAAPAAERDARYREAAATFHRLRNEAGTTPAQWREVADAFQAIHGATPQGRRGADALYSAALSQREAWRSGGEWHDLSGAVARFRQFVADYPADRLADDALMHLGALLADGYHDLPAASDTYRRLVADYPDGDQRAVARQRLAAVERALDEAARRERDAQLAARESAVRAAQAQAAAADKKPANEQSADVAAGEQPAQSPQQSAQQAAQRALAALAAAQAAGAGESGGTSGTARVKAVQFWSALEWTRVILTTDPGVKWEANRLAASDDRPARVYFDLVGAEPADALAALTDVGDAVLERIRVSRYDEGTTRVVLDLNRLERYEVKDFRLPTERKIVVDLHPPAEVVAAQRARAERAAAARETAQAGAQGPQQPAQQPVQAVANRVLPEPSVQVPVALPVRSIMIDPGHGGHDPGANGYGMAEKDLVLDISKRLRDLLAERHPELRVGLTRDADVFIPLQERPEIAKRFGADLFVSVHLNANPIRRFHGIETYFLNLTEDRDALQVAARENATTEQHVSDLNEILRDLMRDTTLVESSELAKTVQASLVGTLRQQERRVRDLGVKQAPFLVLMGAEMPGVLVEAGFLTNRDENERLRDADYLERIAEGIYDGLRRYIEQQNIIAAGQPATPIAANSRL